MVYGLLDQAKARGAAMTITEVDITTHPDLVQQYRILVTPAIAIDGQLEFSGVPTERQLLTRLQERGLALADLPRPEATPHGILERVRGLFRKNFRG